jgi:hypothetical protein
MAPHASPKDSSRYATTPRVLIPIARQPTSQLAGASLRLGTENGVGPGIPTDYR